MAPAALLLLGIVGVGVAAASRRDAATERRRVLARSMRQAADRQLFDDWIALAQDPWAHLVVRRTAWSAASFLKKLWLDTGRSGMRMPRGLSLRIYGNWCGPGYGGGPCLDEIDCACRAHDLAYGDAAAIEDGP